MARRVTLRKCPDHPDCQLQQIDGGEWEHTPAKRTLRERLSKHDLLSDRLQAELSKAEELRRMLSDIGRESKDAVAKATAGLPNVGDLRAELREGLSRVSEMQRILAELGERVAATLADVQNARLNLPKTLDLQAKANRAREYLDSQVKIAQEAGERLERAFQRADTEAGHQAARLRELQAAEERIEQAERRAEETLALATEKLAQADILLATLEERKVQLDGVDALFDLVDNVLAELRSTAAALRASDKETRRQIEHERRERLDATAKGLKSVQEHIRVSHA